MLKEDRFRILDEKLEFVETDDFAQLLEFKSSGVDYDNAGVYYNREIIKEYSYYVAYKTGWFKSWIKQYDNNRAYSKKITNKKLIAIIDYCSTYNYYNVLTNSCAHIAVNSWNTVFEGDMIISEKLLMFIHLPTKVKKEIGEKSGSYIFDMYQVIKDIPYK